MLRYLFRCLFLTAWLLIACSPPSTAIEMPLDAEAVGGRWRTGASLPVPIAEVAAASWEGFIYTGGGFSSGIPTSVTTWFGRYDVAGDRWQTLAELPLRVHHFGLAAAEGRVWLAGGYVGLTFASPGDHLYAYDPQQDSWTPMAAMPGRRAAHFLLALDGRLYVVGGVGDAPEEMWIYDLAAGVWSTAAGPTPREHLGAAASGSRVYVVAGRGFGRGIVGALEAYDPATGEWQRLADMPVGCGGCSAAATADGRIHVTGGEGGGRTYGEHFIYDPATDAWSMAAPLPTPRHGIGAAAAGERFYVIGGGRQQGLSYSDIVEWWSPEQPLACQNCLYTPRIVGP